MPAPSALPNLHAALNLLIGIFVVFGVFLQILGVSTSGWAWLFAFVFYVGLNYRMVRTNGAILLALSAAALLLAFYLTGTVDLEGIVRASFLFALMLLFRYVAPLADQTDEIGTMAELVVSRPAGQRYLFVTFGTHVMAMLLHIGGLMFVIALLRSRMSQLGPAVYRSLVAGAMRGFGANSIWSPFAIAVLVTLSGVPSVTYLHFAPVGFFVMVCYLLTGYLLERPLFTTGGRRLTSEDRRLICWVAFAVLALSLAIAGIAHVSGYSLIQVVFLVVLAGAMAWTFLLIRRGVLQLRSLGGMTAQAVASVTNENVIVWTSNVLGIVAGSMLVNAGWLHEGFSPWLATLIAGLLPGFIVLCAVLAVNPLASVAILVGLLNPVWPEAAKFWLVLPLVWGWGASAGGTAFMANILLTAKQIGVSSPTLAYGWNGRFTLITVVVFSIVSACGTALSLM
ncbi:MAG: hypothetical protein H6883_13155 [Rhodobiaceae bacterium]|nr:hypothetical protein [Rhodobiaceae bacterium]